MNFYVVKRLIWEYFFVQNLSFASYAFWLPQCHQIISSSFT